MSLESISNLEIRKETLEDFLYRYLIEPETTKDRQSREELGMGTFALNEGEQQEQPYKILTRKIAAIIEQQIPGQINDWVLLTRFPDLKATNYIIRIRSTCAKEASGEERRDFIVKIGWGEQGEQIMAHNRTRELFRDTESWMCAHTPDMTYHIITTDASHRTTERRGDGDDTSAPKASEKKYHQVTEGECPAVLLPCTIAITEQSNPEDLGTELDTGKGEELAPLIKEELNTMLGTIFYEGDNCPGQQSAQECHAQSIRGIIGIGEMILNRLEQANKKNIFLDTLVIQQIKATLQEIKGKAEIWTTSIAGICTLDLAPKNLVRVPCPGIDKDRLMDVDFYDQTQGIYGSPFIALGYFMAMVHLQKTLREEWRNKEYREIQEAMEQNYLSKQRGEERKKLAHRQWKRADQGMQYILDDLQNLLEKIRHELHLNVRKASMQIRIAYAMVLIYEAYVRAKTTSSEDATSDNYRLKLTNAVLLGVKQILNPDREIWEQWERKMLANQLIHRPIRRVQRGMKPQIAALIRKARQTIQEIALRKPDKK